MWQKPLSYAIRLIEENPPLKFPTIFFILEGKKNLKLKVKVISNWSNKATENCEI